MQIKRDMVGNLERKHTHGGRLDRHIAEKVSDLKAISLPSLVNEKSLEFFKILDIPSEFLREDPSLWPTSASFKVISLLFTVLINTPKHRKRNFF